ncbi:hypothetical protein BJY04DRAFT_202142 [Aspergillus karnatakaensis]|uniref:uncharacterized protein n=1 Tax=Aspergillus karnatakaensis TaxID=1810916 RepID=UPI003CCCD34C
MSFTRPTLLRLTRAANPRPLTRTPQTRRYATAPDQPSGSNSTWLVISAALALPAGYYLLSGGSAKASKSPSEQDAPSTRKEAGSGNQMSGKQEGLSNATTDNPYVNEPGKSVKGEGETETAKVKGTVSPERPQR